MEPAFEEVISERHRLRELSRQLSDRARAKIIDHIDDVCRRFIAASSFVLVASRGGDRRMDISPNRLLKNSGAPRHDTAKFALRPS
jgi:uncharacterized protein